MIYFTDKWAICPKNHFVYDRDSCAHCDGYTEAEFLATKVKGKSFIGTPKVALSDSLGRMHPMHKADVINGWRADRKPPTGWYVYYITFTEGGKQYWKVGITENPGQRLMREVAPTLLDLKYFGPKADAYREEQRLLRIHNPYRIRMNIPRLRNQGTTEMFDRDALNGRLN